jgi:hypothetical protein
LDPNTAPRSSASTGLSFFAIAIGSVTQAAIIIEG